jgi:branched-chain amino acid transport system permease protein
MFLQTFIDGIMIGSVYSTIAVGLSLGFGLMRIVNWAQGELLMVGLYIVFFAITGLGADPYLTILIAGPAMFAFGYFMQKYPINSLLDKDKAREPQSIMMFTSGLGLFLTNFVTYLFSSNTKYTTTKYTATSWIIDEMVISKPKFISGIVALIATLILYVIVQKTEFGRALRATAQNRQVAQLMGIDNKKIYAVAQGMGVALVGVAASLLIPNVTIFPTIGANYSIKCMIIVVLGGRGSIPGCLLGGLLIGLIEKFGTLFWTESYAQLIVFAVFVFMLMFRPNGLLGKEN